MLWKKNCPKIGFGIFSLVFVCALLCSFFLDTTSVFADSNPTGIIDNTTYSQYICSSDVGIPAPYDCSPYSYIRFDVVNLPDPYTSDRYFTFGTNFGSIRDFRVSFSYSSSIFDISNFTLIYQIVNQYSMGNGSMRWTLLESIGSGIVPSGSLSITQNGTFDVTSYAEAVVDVPAVPGDYHNDLVSIYNAILICAATCLVIYFFYCIYRMIIKSTGGK